MPRSTRRDLLRVSASAIAAAGLSQAARAQAPAAPALRLGALYPGSGPLAALGQEGMRGLELAVEARNASGGVFGRPIALVRQDPLNGAQAAQAARQLMSVGRVAAIFGTAASPLALPASWAAELQGIPYFELGAPADGLTARDFRFVFRSAPTAMAEAVLSVQACATLLPTLWNNPLAPLRVALLHEGGPYGQSVAGTQEALLRQGLGPVPVGRFGYPPTALPQQPGTPPPPADFAALAARLKDSRPDVVLHTGYAPEAVALLRALRGGGWAPRMLIGSASGYGLGEAAREAAADLGGVMVIGATPYAVGGPLAEGAAALAARYAARYGGPPVSAQSLQEARGAAVFLEALHRAGTPEPARIREAVLAMRAADAPPGFPVEFDASGQNRLARPALSQWQGEGEAMRLVTLLPREAALAPPVARLALAGGA